MNGVVEQYLATWNATGDERAKLLTEHWAPRATYTDPMAEARGHEEIAAVVDGVRTQFPGCVFTRIGEADAHHRQVRFRWGLGPQGAEPLVIGFDVLVLDESGRIQDVHGFLDKAPGMAGPRAYVIGYLEQVELGPQIAEYIERIEATMAPYGGRFLVHGGRLVPHEGDWDGDIVMLEFPDLASAQEWYESPGYQAILPLRTEYSTSTVAAVEGVPDGYRAAAKIRQLFPQQAVSAG